MPRIPVALCTTIRLDSPAGKIIPRQSFQGSLHLVNLTCAEFLAQPHVLAYVGGKVIFSQRTDDNVNRNFLCRDGWIEYNRNDPFLTARQTSHPAVLSYFTYNEADASAAFAQMTQAEVPPVFLVGNQSVCAGRAVYPVTATLAELVSPHLPLLAEEGTLRPFDVHTYTLLLTRDGKLAWNTEMDRKNFQFRPYIPEIDTQAAEEFQKKFA